MRYVALVALGCFCVLASYAYGTTAPHMHTVPQAITAEVDMDPQARTHGGYGKAERSAAVKLWRRVERDLDDRRAAETLAAVYGITAENANAYRRWWK